MRQSDHQGSRVFFEASNTNLRYARGCSIFAGTVSEKTHSHAYAIDVNYFLELFVLSETPWMEQT